MITTLCLYIITILTAAFSLYIKVYWLDKNLFSFQEENLINNIFFWIMFGIFIFMTIYRFLKDKELVLEIRKAYEELKNINTDNINEYYSEINEKFLDDKEYKYLNNNWRAFKNSLFRTEENKYYQSIDAEEFYNKENLLQEKMNFRLMNYVPQLLVGLGMLGTFLGLSIGIADLNLGTDDMKQLVTLISGTKTAFYTSLYGMYFSISISIIFNIYFGFYEEKILMLKNSINHVFKKYIKDEKVEEIKNEMILVRKNTEELSRNVGKELVKGVQEYNRSSREHLHNLTELVNTNISGLADNVSGAFEEKLDKIFSEEFIFSFIELKDKLVEVSKYNNEEITKYAEIVSNMNGNLLQIKTSLENFTQTTLNEFNSVMDRVENKYREITESTEASKEIYIKYVELLSNSKDIITSSNTSLDKLEKISNIFTSFSEQEEKLVEFWNNNRKIMTSLTDSLEKTKEEELKRVENYQKTVLEKLDEYHKRFNDRTMEQEEKMSEYYKKHLEELFSEYDSSLGKAIVVFKDILKELGEKLEITEEKLKSSNELLEKEKEVIEEKMKLSQENRVIELDKTTSEYDNMIKSLRKLSETINNSLLETVDIVKEKNIELKELKEENSIKMLVETNNNIFRRIEELSKNLDIRLKDHNSSSEEEKEIIKESCFELIDILKMMKEVQNSFNEGLLENRNQQEEILLTLKRLLLKNDLKPSRVSKYTNRR